MCVCREQWSGATDQISKVIIFIFMFLVVGSSYALSDWIGEENSSGILKFKCIFLQCFILKALNLDRFGWIGARGLGIGSL